MKVSVRPAVPSYSWSKSCENQEALDVVKLVQRDPTAWRRWLEWLPEVCLRGIAAEGSPFTSPANTSLHQRVFLGGTSVKVPLK